MPMAPIPPSPPSPPTHTAPTMPRVRVPVAQVIPVAADGEVTDPELERRWASVKAHLSAVLQAVRESRQPVRTEAQRWVNVYSDVAKLYTHNDDLRKRRMYVHVRQFVRDLVAAQLNHLQGLTGPLLLAEYCKTWRASMTFIGFMKRVLHHLHRFWIPENANSVKDDPVRPLDKLLMFYWREDLLSRLHDIISIALQLVNDDRSGFPIDHSIVRGVVDTLVEIGGADLPAPEPDTSSSKSQTDSSPSLPNLHLYIRVFEDDFLTLTRTFYKAEGEKMVGVGDVTKFMKNVIARLEEEDQRGKRLLHPDSGPRLRQATEEQLIGNHKEYLQREATNMVKAGREDDLKLLYTLLSRVENGLGPLRTFFVGFVRAEGNNIIVDHVDKTAGKDDMKTNLSLVRTLVRLYRKHASLIKRCFDGSQVIMLGIDDAFRGFANRSLGTLSLPNLLAHYVDHLLRLGPAFDRFMWDTSDGLEVEPQAKVDRTQVNTDGLGSESTCADEIVTPPNKRPRLQQATQGERPQGNGISNKEDDPDKDDDGLSHYMTELVRLFMYLDDKDLFFETHRRLFAKRLLASHDEDMEMRFISKVKVQMGPTYTQRLSGMLKDKGISNTLRTQFSQYLAKRRKEHREMVSGGGAKNKDSEQRNNDGKSAPEDGKKKGQIEGGRNTATTDNGSGDQQRLLRSDATRTVSSALVEAPRVSEWLRITASPGLASSPEKDKNETDGQGKNDGKETCPLSFEDVGEALRIDFNAHVLNALHWPSVKVSELRVPPVLKTCQRLFAEFYMKDKETRKLSWIHSLSTVHLAAWLGGKRYTLLVSTFQACALLMFNKQDSITVRNACEELNISRSELNQHIKPLMLARKCRILRLEKRDPEDSDPSDADVVMAEEDQDNNDNSESTKKVAEQSSAGESERLLGAQGELATPEEQQARCTGVVENGQGERQMDTDANEAPSEADATQPDATQPDATQPDATQPNATQAETDMARDSRSSAPQGMEENVNANEANTQNEANRKEDMANAAIESGNVGGLGSGSECDDELADGDVIHLNLKFKSNTFRIGVPASIAKLASADAAVSKRNVVVDRSTQVDATLVRIMKARKEMTHASLTAEVIETLAPMFVPDPRLIKSRLERLIDQEYVERDAADPRLYRYSA